MRKLSPDEVWMRALEAAIGSVDPSTSGTGTIGRYQVLHAIDRADEVVEAFKDRFCREDDE